MGDAAGLGLWAGDALAAGDAPGLDDALGFGEGELTSVTAATGLLWLRFKPIGTTMIPSAVTIRKLTAPHSRRRKSLFREPP